MPPRGSHSLLWVPLTTETRSSLYAPNGQALDEKFLKEGIDPVSYTHLENFVRTHLKVKDNGIGMSPEFLQRIYESYSRADEARIHKTEGAGLGMAITKYIVDAMGGTIDIQSELNKGTEFHITCLLYTSRRHHDLCRRLPRQHKARLRPGRV